jgi:FKBP-type peptidyl-prolyl cis-trans isomerase
MKNLIAVTLAVAAAAGCGRLTGGGGAPKTEDDKTLYALGMIIGRNLTDFNLTPRELDVVKAGMTDVVQKKKTAVELETYGPKVDAFHTARRAGRATAEKEAGKKAVEAAAREPGAVRTASGAIVRTVKPGTGAAPQPTDRVKVNYTGKLLDGTVFDSSKKQGQPVTFPLNGVIKCWTEGVAMMKVGGKSRLVCPADIAYGDRGHPPQIKPGATLVFDVDLLAIEPPGTEAK